MEEQSIWFLMLFALGIVILSTVFVKKKDSMLVPFYLAIVGLAYVFEYIIKIIFECYVYYPRLLDNRYYDDLMGANASQAFTVPAVALLIAAFRLNIWWSILFAGVFIGIEELFLALNIFEHHWWRTWYTSVSLLVFFPLSKRWLYILHQNRVSILQFLTLLLAVLALMGSQDFYTSALFNTHSYHIGWVANESRDSLLFGLPFFLLISILYTVVVFFKTKARYKVYTIIVFLLTDFILWKLGILNIHKSWIIVYIPIINILILWFASRMHRTLTSE